MRIPEYEMYERRSLPWVVRWGVRAVVWSLMGLTLLMGWWGKYVLDNAEPFEGLHSGEHWISLEQLSPEARGFVEVRWERPYGDLAMSSWSRRHDHMLTYGLMHLYPLLYSEVQARGLALNRQVLEVDQSLMAPEKMTLDVLLRRVWSPEWKLKWALERLVEEGQMTDHRRDELLFQFCGDVPPHIKANEEPQELSDDLRRHCRK